MSAETVVSSGETLFFRKKRSYVLLMSAFIAGFFYFATKAMTLTTMFSQFIAPVIAFLCLLAITRLAFLIFVNPPYLLLTDDTLSVSTLFGTKTIRWDAIKMIEAPSNDCSSTSHLRLSCGKGRRIQLSLDELTDTDLRPACTIHAFWDSAQSSN